jgi:hypothetical protein
MLEQCELCNYFFRARAPRHDQECLCAVCEARTSPQVRSAFRRGERVANPYMDSD